jgi:hypothetical protein
LPQRTTEERSRFLAEYSPDRQVSVAEDADDCVMGDYPTLSEVKSEYGANTPVMWLIPQLYDLSEYCGCRDKLQGRALEGCAEVIASEFYYLKPTELMLFFRWFKAGRYGRFYGSIDPLVITTSLQTFISERNEIIAKHEREESDRKRKEWSRDAITYEEYLKNYKNKRL